MKLTVTTIRKKAKEYFDYCEKETKMPTVNGLAFALGFCTKDEMLYFDGDTKCKEEIKRSLLFLEKQIEEALYSKELFQTAKFVLCTQFFGWSEKDDKAQAPIYIVDHI